MPSRNNKCNAFAAFFHQEFSREVNRAFCKKEDFWIIGSFYGRSLLFPKRIFYLSFLVNHLSNFFTLVFPMVRFVVKQRTPSFIILSKESSFRTTFLQRCQVERWHVHSVQRRVYVRSTPRYFEEMPKGLRFKLSSERTMRRFETIPTVKCRLQTLYWLILCWRANHTWKI